MLTRIAIGFLSMSGFALAQTKCTDLEGAKPEALLDYLRGDRSTLKPDCMRSAMLQIASTLDGPGPQGGEAFKSLPAAFKAGAIKTIIGYLDYRIPESKLSAAISRSTGRYLAWDALTAIGEPAVPALVATIASEDTPAAIRSWAISTMFAICNTLQQGPSGAVRVLKRASQAASDFQESMRLIEAARKAADICKPLGTNECLDALYSKESQ